MAGNTIDATDATFETEVLKSDVPVLVDFWAAWCAPCKAIAPHLDQLAQKRAGQLKIVKVDAQNNMPTARKFNVQNLPTFVLFQNGVEVSRKIGTGGGIVAIEKLVDDAASF